jgi:carbamate kinase
MSRIVIALGGNALGDTAAEQRERIDAAAPALVGLIAQGHEIIVSHGNGPQVGAIRLAFDTASAAAPGRVPVMDLPECTAMSQGYVGYHLQQGIAAELRRVGMPWHVATVVTQVEVDPADPAFTSPTKPIGAFYDEPTARRMMADEGLRMVEDAGRGWRTVVASPRPVRIVERESILNLLDHEFIVIACGGGGVPVVREADGRLRGVAAVIDKDFASAALAEAVGADHLFILTAVDRVAIGFGTPEQRDLDRLSVAEAQRYLEDGQFAAGSMRPKVEAAVRFASSSPGRTAVICSLEKAPLAMRGESGTVIHGVQVGAVGALGLTA